MKMTLSRALRYKKRVVENIRRLESDVQLSNSVVKDEERVADVELSLRKREEWVKHLIALKLAVQKATEPIQRAVFELAEAKAECAFLQRISTQHGTTKPRYREEAAITYEAIIKKADQDKRVAALQDKIDTLQTKLDQHNATTEVEIPDLKL